MKNVTWRKGLPLLMAAAVLLTSISLPVSASAPSSGEITQSGEESAAAAGTEETASAAAPETAVPLTEEKEGDGNDNSQEDSDNQQDEPSSDKITITPSNANALVLMDVGAQSPKGTPGNVVDVVLPIAVNREYLPSENYTLRNITIKPNISGSSGSSSSSGSGTGSGTSGSTASVSWPFDIIDASYTRHLDDMSYNSTAEVWYKFRISEFAKKGVYPVNFTVTATVWRKDAVNGTEITEDVNFTLGVYVTVVDDGDLSGVVSNIGALEIGGYGDGAVNTSPMTSPGQSITLNLPIVNKGGHLSNITISPVVSGSLDEFPFVVDKLAYGISLDDMDTGETQNFTYTFVTSPYATTGNKPVTFRASYEENGITGECTFTTYVYVKDGYEDLSQMAPVATMQSWSLWVVQEDGETEVTPQEIVYTTARVNVREGMSTESKVYKQVPSGTMMTRLEQNEDRTWSKVLLDDSDGAEYYVSSKYLVSGGTGSLEHLEKVTHLTAGDEAVIRMSFINNSNERTIVDTAATLTIPDPTALTLTTGSSDTSYLGVLKPGQSAQAEFRVTVPAAAPVGTTSLTVTANYANTAMATKAVTQTIMIPIKQPMNVQADEPVVYGTPKTDEPFSVSLNIVNKGRSKAYNLSVSAMDGISMAESYYGGDVLPAGSLAADVELKTAKSGSFTGTLMVSYEDSDGELYTQYIELPLQVVQSVPVLTEEELTEEKSGISIWLILLLLLLILAAAGAGAYLWYRFKKKGAGSDGEKKETDFWEEDEGDKL